MICKYIPTMLLWIIAAMDRNRNRSEQKTLTVYSQIRGRRVQGARAALDLFVVYLV